MIVCSVVGCDRPHSGRGLCSMHYKRWRRHGDVDAGDSRDEITPPVCICDEPDPDEIGQCRECGRPYRYGLLTCRAAWRLYLEGARFP